MYPGEIPRLIYFHVPCVDLCGYDDFFFPTQSTSSSLMPDRDLGWYDCRQLYRPGPWALLLCDTSQHCLHCTRNLVFGNVPCS